MVSVIIFFIFTFFCIDKVTCREPSDITRSINATNVFIPCPYEFQPAPPIWRINNIDYISSTLPSIFSQDPGGLFINVVHPCLDHFSFQCIDTSGPGLVGRKSQVGVLTVLPQGSCSVTDLLLFQRNIIQSNDSTIELDHKRLKFGISNTTLVWKIFTNDRACNTSQILSHPPCQPNNISMNTTIDNTEITVQAQMSGIHLDFDISSLDQNDPGLRCPKLPDAVRVNATETKTLNLLKGKNNCTSTEVECDGALQIAISNPNPRKKDILCPAHIVMDTSCFNIEECHLFVRDGILNLPIFSVCETSPVSTTYMVRFENNHANLTGTKVDFFALSNTPALCESEQLPYTRIYCESYAINVVAGRASVSVNSNSGKVCFFSLVENCTYMDLTLYNISVTDVSGYLIFTSSNIPESDCITIEELTASQCAPYFLLVQPFTVGDYIIYDPSNETIPHDTTDGDLCSCISQNVQLELILDQSNEEIQYKCHSQYISLIDIAFSLGNENSKRNCTNGSITLTDMDIYANCGNSSKTNICGYLVFQNGIILSDCPLSSCIQLECPTASPTDTTTTAPTRRIIVIVLSTVIPLLIAAILAVLIFIAIVVCYIHYRSRHHQLQPQIPPPNSDNDNL